MPSEKEKVALSAALLRSQNEAAIFVLFQAVGPSHSRPRRVNLGWHLEEIVLAHAIRFRRAIHHLDGGPDVAIPPSPAPENAGLICGHRSRATRRHISRRRQSPDHAAANVNIRRSVNLHHGDLLRLIDDMARYFHPFPGIDRPSVPKL